MGSSSTESKEPDKCWYCHFPIAWCDDCRVFTCPGCRRRWTAKEPFRQDSGRGEVLPGPTRDHPLNWREFAK